MVGIFPIYIGAIMLSCSLFSASYRYQSPAYAAMNLYAMINGDELQDTFRDLSSLKTIAGIIFLYLIYILWNGVRFFVVIFIMFNISL